MIASLGRTPDLETGNVLSVPDGEWFSAFDRLRPLDPITREAHRRIIETAGGKCCFRLIERDNESIACGLGVLVEDAVGLFDLFTGEAYRRNGHGASIVGSILRWAHGHDARTAFLQVHSENEPAHNLYRGFGFEVAYPYWYRAKPG